ncbi:MAG: serine/threonine-protein kinase [Planctomycetia bacterium]|nr:serine/threonine-protein kinase [Planctomycetia bacterium]
MARAESPQPHDGLHGPAAVTPGQSPPSTAPTSDTQASGDRLSQRSADFGLAADRFRTGPDPLIGVDLGGVRIERLIGEGGMGRVYEALQTNPARTVAVKVMRTLSPGDAAQQRFRREADALARLRHPGIAQIFTAGCHRLGIVDVPYYVMEFIPGAESLVQACERRRVPLRNRIELLLAVCDAVAHGHAEGIVHRDLKPGNILVDAEGRPKIIDFGIARMDGVEADDDGPRTETGQFIGTRPYMAPEQFVEHRATIDARTDVYAVGVVMHELVSGRLPYDVAGKSLVETARIVQETRPARLNVAGATTADRGLIRGADAIAAMCLHKDPAARYPSAAAVAADLRRLLAGEPLAAAPARTALSEVFRGSGRWPRRMTVALLAAAGLCAAIMGMAGGGRLPEELPDQTVGSASGVSAGLSARPVAVRFANVSSGRTAPLEWVDLKCEHDVSGLVAEDFRLTRNGEAIDVAGLTVTGGRQSWRIGGLAALTSEAGDYTLAAVGTRASPVDAGGRVVAISGQTQWRSPPYHEIRFSPIDDDWERHVVSLTGVERYTETHAGATMFIRPTVAGREGVITLRFDMPFTIQDAMLTAPLAVWTTGDPFPYDPGARAALDVSVDGEAWTTLVELKAGAGGFNTAAHDIGRIVAGGRQIWVRVRLTATKEWPGDGLIFAQFLRTDPKEQGAGFLLTATGPHPPVIPPATP